MLRSNKGNLVDCFHKDNHNNRQAQVDYLEINSKDQLQLEEQVHYLAIHSNSSKDKHHKIYLLISRNKQLRHKEIHYFSNKDNQQQLLLRFHLVAHNSNQERLLQVDCLVMPHNSSNQVNNNKLDFSILSNKNKSRLNKVSHNKVAYSDSSLKTHQPKLKEDFLVQQMLKNQILILSKPSLLPLYLGTLNLGQLALNSQRKQLQEDYLEILNHKLPISLNLQFLSNSNLTPRNKINHKNKLLPCFLVNQIPNKQHLQLNRLVCFSHLRILLHRIHSNNSSNRLLLLPIKLEIPLKTLKLPFQKVEFLQFLFLKVRQEGCLVINLQNRLNLMVKVDSFKITNKLLHLIKCYLLLQVLLIHSLELGSKTLFNLRQLLNSHNQLQLTLKLQLVHSHRLQLLCLEEIIKLLTLQKHLPHLCLPLLLKLHHN